MAAGHGGPQRGAVSEYQSGMHAAMTPVDSMKPPRYPWIRRGAEIASGAGGGWEGARRLQSQNAWDACPEGPESEAAGSSVGISAASVNEPKGGCPLMLEAWMGSRTDLGAVAGGARVVRPSKPVRSTECSIPHIPPVRGEHLVECRRAHICRCGGAARTAFAAQYLFLRLLPRPSVLPTAFDPTGPPPATGPAVERSARRPALNSVRSRYQATARGQPASDPQRSNPDTASLAAQRPLLGVGQLADGQPGRTTSSAMPARPSGHAPGR